VEAGGAAQVRPVRPVVGWMLLAAKPDLFGAIFWVLEKKMNFFVS
jgi:hypothetical protein